jgi:hypothetical protein
MCQAEKTCKKDQKERQFIGLKHGIKIKNIEEVMVTASATEEEVHGWNIFM